MPRYYKSLSKGDDHIDIKNGTLKEEPFSMYGSCRDVYAETAYYRHFSKHIHYHDYYQCMLINKGSCVHCVDSRRTLLQVHDAFILPPGIPHIMECPSPNLEFYQLAIKESYFQKLIKNPSLLNSYHIRSIVEQGEIQDHLSFHISLVPHEFHSVLSLMDCLKLELSVGDNLSDVIIENVICSILLIFNRVLMNMEALQNKKVDHLQKDRIDTINTILQYIDLNYSKPLTVEILAKQTSMSRTIFYENFCRLVGQSPHRYITEKRITAAKQLLQDTYMVESEIASCVGFRDLSTFHRNFIKICGCTPGQFRSQTKKSSSWEL